MSCLLSLPDEVLKLVMQHVPLKTRLTSCCLLNKRLHAAAMAATQEVHLHHFGTERVDSWSTWLDQFGQQLTYLGFTYFPKALLQLPRSCTNLLELFLDGDYTPFGLQLGPAAVNDYPGVIHACTKLTRLEVCKYVVGDVMDAPVLDCLSTLVHLQHFVWCETNQLTLSSATLPRMQQLTHLDVQRLSVDNLQQLGGLTNLQELHLDIEGSITVGPSTVPGMAFPACLTELVLSSAVEAGLLSSVPTGLQHLELKCVVQGPAEAPGVFLSGMARLQHLTCLHIDYTDLEWPPVGRAYSALMASSNLVELSMCDAGLPRDVWMVAFWPLRKLPHLTSLKLFNDVYRDEYTVGLAWDGADISHLMECCPNLRTISAISLQHGPHVSELHKLTALTSMHVMFGPVEGWGSVNESMSALAAITQLEQLTGCIHGCDVSMGSLLPLTGLTALTELRFVSRPGSGHGSDDDDGADDGAHLGGLAVFLSKSYASQDPDVWLQLLRECATDDSSCQPAALCSLAQQLAEQRALSTQQQQQLADQQVQLDAQKTQNWAQHHQIWGQQGQITRQQKQLAVQKRLFVAQQQQLVAKDCLLSEHQQQLAAQQQQSAAQQQQLAAQQQVSAEQGAQIAGLQQQLQALQSQLQELLQRPQL